MSARPRRRPTRARRAATSHASRTDFARIAPASRRRMSTKTSFEALAPVCDSAVRAPSSVRPLLRTTTSFSGGAGRGDRRAKRLRRPQALQIENDDLGAFAARQVVDHRRGGYVDGVAHRHQQIEARAGVRDAGCEARRHRSALPDDRNRAGFDIRDLERRARHIVAKAYEPEAIGPQEPDSRLLDGQPGARRPAPRRPRRSRKSRTRRSWRL